MVTACGAEFGAIGALYHSFTTTEYTCHTDAPSQAHRNSALPPKQMCRNSRKSNARQQERFNFQWISGALATYGYHTHRVPDDREGADALLEDYEVGWTIT